MSWYSIERLRLKEMGTLMTGKQSIAFTHAPYVLGSGSVAGKKEGEGPLGKYFDAVCEEPLFGEDTWEAAESALQRQACVLALGKTHRKPEEVRFCSAATSSGRGRPRPLGWRISRSRCLASTGPVLHRGKPWLWRR